MRVDELILKKREGQALTAEEIDFLIKGYVEGRIPDYQMSAWAMAVFFRGMETEEIVNLTCSMVYSGEIMDLSSIPGIKLDKHSTGGVGDTTTLVLAPLVAAAGGKMAKMSGRGLGFTGGTLDKFESIPGFNVNLSREEFIAVVKQVGAAVIGQSGNLVPADKKLYALRDVTATVDSIPLIASSVMSKKIAAGAEAIIIDVKAGSGALVKTLQEAKELASLLVQIGRGMGRRVKAAVTSMEQPLGYAVGNALEVKEAVETLQGKGPADLTELCLVLGAHLLVMGETAPSYEAARMSLEEALHSGRAWKKFLEMAAAQGGDTRVLEDVSLLPRASAVVEVKSPGRGFVQSINAEAIGRAAVILGAGRERKEDSIDPAVGIVLRKKIGDEVEAGETLAELHANEPAYLEKAAAMVSGSYLIGKEKPALPPLINFWVE